MHTGHFYFAKNRTFLLCVDIQEQIMLTIVTGCDIKKQGVTRVNALQL